MLQLKTQLLLTGALALACAIPAAAQQTPAPASPAAPEFVTHTSFRNRVFEVKHRDPNTLAVALRALGSGHRGATITASRDFMTLTVRDFPENIATIEEALRRLDTPEAARPDIELRIHVLLATNTEGAPEQLPAELRDVVRQLQSTLNYRNYHLVTTLIRRAREGSRGVAGDGTIELSPAITGMGRTSNLNYRSEIQYVTLSSSSEGVTTTQLHGFFFTAASEGAASIRTDVNLRDNERVVVGTANLRDRALILVLSARVIR